MKGVFRNFLSSLPAGTRVFLLLFALGFPIAFIVNRTGVLDLYQWLALSPPLVWRGQVWRMLTCVFLPLGVVDWAISLFWLVTLVSIVGRNWRARLLWGYCMLAALAGSLLIVLLKPGFDAEFAGWHAINFALLAAWFRTYGRERIILLGIGEISVRQAAILVALIDAIVLFFSCAGWIFLLSALAGGVAGWIYLAADSKRLMSRRARQVESERVARLEL